MNGLLPAWTTEASKCARPTQTRRLVQVHIRAMGQDAAAGKQGRRSWAGLARGLVYSGPGVGKCTAAASGGCLWGLGRGPAGNIAAAAVRGIKGMPPGAGAGARPGLKRGGRAAVRHALGCSGVPCQATRAKGGAAGSPPARLHQSVVALLARLLVLANLQGHSTASRQQPSWVVDASVGDPAPHGPGSWRPNASRQAGGAELVGAPLSRPGARRQAAGAEPDGAGLQCGQPLDCMPMLE